MKTLIEKQSDGYMVELDNEMVVITSPKGKHSFNYTYYKPWTEISQAKKDAYKGRIPDTTGLWSECGGGLTRIRDIGDACKIISDMVSSYREERDLKAKKAEQDYAEKMERAKAIVGEGYIPCYVSYFDGYPSIIEVEGIKINYNNNILKEAEGLTFVLKSAYENACVEIENKKNEILRKEAEERLHTTECFKIAKETGNKVLLDKWQTNKCMNKSVDCSFDMAYKYAMPDGTTKTTYICCF